MGQSRLNHIMILSIYKEEVDDINIDLLGDEFIRGSEHLVGRSPTFAFWRQNAKVGLRPTSEHRGNTVHL